ncbi:MAG TPA: hypothetical protein PLI98_04535, partial [Candidatus Hydrogenedentes bacterium]|nr:hypothetical protein [Candidatus Hydrogenedentota bacterium]
PIRMVPSPVFAPADAGAACGKIAESPAANKAGEWTKWTEWTLWTGQPRAGSILSVHSVHLAHNVHFSGAPRALEALSPRML